MGMDAKVTIWVGVGEDFDIEELQDKLPHMFDREDDEFTEHIDSSEANKHYGVEIESVYCSDEVCGVGVVVFSHDWDYGVKEFDFANLEVDSVIATRQLRQLFDKHGVTQMIKVWVQTDYR